MPPVMIEMVPGFEVVAVMPPVRVRTPVGLSVGAAPPGLERLSVERVLSPANVTVAPPLRVKAWEGITPPAV